MQEISLAHWALPCRAAHFHRQRKPTQNARVSWSQSTAIPTQGTSAEAQALLAPSPTGERIWHMCLQPSSISWEARNSFKAKVILCCTLTRGLTVSEVSKNCCASLWAQPSSSLYKRKPTTTGMIFVELHEVKCKVLHLGLGNPKHTVWVENG